MNRRAFLGGAAGSAVVAHSRPANERVTVAVIGIRGQGGNLAAAFASLPDVNVAWLCDADQRVYPKTAANVEQRCGRRPPYVQDLRRVLDDKSVDAVVIATPDHWHAPATIMACDAGKDVYVEKPASHNLREGQLMVAAARRNRRVVQLGTQSRSRPSTIRAIELAQSGRIGRVLMAKAWNAQLRADIGHQEDSDAPPGVDFDLWTGPAPALPFNENRFHYKWHWHWNYGTGDIGNDGVHQLDIARWGLGVDLPAAVSGMGRKVFFHDDQKTPDTMSVAYDFGEKVLLFEMRIWNPYGLEELDNGVALYGTSGMVRIGAFARRWGYKVFDAKGKVVMEDIPEQADEFHHRNFIDCVKSRQAPNAEIEIGHTSTVLCHLGNVVARTGRNLKFEPATQSIMGDTEATHLLGREYRRHWSVPKGA